MPSPVASVQSLLMSVIDYAGLFPPAKLDMATTVRNYANYLNLEEGWMMGRLIVPVARLDEFEREVRQIAPRTGEVDLEPWQISAITANASDLDAVAADLALIQAFNKRLGEDGLGLASIDVIELKAETTDAISGVLDEMPDDLFPFFELPIDRDPRGLIAALVDGEAGAKVRTGGITAEAYPSPENLARFIAACAAVNIPFKATAGMHHPLRHFSDAVKTKEFGFLNVFMAGCLADAHELDEPTLRQVLEDDFISRFKFDEGGATWSEYRLGIDEIEESRDGFAVSFGSCSFEEPIDGLKSLNLL